ncbi:hypothetical protein OIU74_026411 [Salix koriyanagi]|uniref:Uncharacterized protein n=1 Tax=Salix koriyanagi TaxID=2511006 RepID=A0A9Q0VYX9_9ROSI|nr:hypothetical protein OIU74_026411 [Salix koriyanagi]
MKNWENYCTALQSQTEECYQTLTQFFYLRKVQAARNRLHPSPNLLKRPRSLVLLFYFVVKKCLGCILQCRRNLDRQFRFCFEGNSCLIFCTKEEICSSHMFINQKWKASFLYC